MLLNCSLFPNSIAFSTVSNGPMMDRATLITHLAVEHKITFYAPALDLSTEELIAFHDSLHDPSNIEVLVYDSLDRTWKPKS